jgi:hypothetical protein
MTTDDMQRVEEIGGQFVRSNKRDRTDVLAQAEVGVFSEWYQERTRPRLESGLSSHASSIRPEDAADGAATDAYIVVRSIICSHEPSIPVMNDTHPTVVGGVIPRYKAKSL